MALAAHYVGLCIRYIQTIKITDIIDMAIIAYIFYHLLRLTQRTRTGQLLKGIVFVLLAMAVSYYCRLNVLYFLLKSVVEIGFLAIIVVFQPEIRRFLEQTGSIVGIFRLGTQPKQNETERALMQTVDAFHTMSEDHVGALVVFERGDILDEIIKSGTELDAAVTSELLKNIFWPKAPLHDGAVIIREGRVHSAGCVLPLTSNVNISRDLGTRHRAGIGVSEHSDAVVAIVSEETGAISVAVGGMLKRHLSLETMEQLLRNELIPQEEETKGRRTLRSLLHRRKGDDADVD